MATGAVLVLAFPEGGTEPFAASAFWPALRRRADRRGAARGGPCAPAALLYALVLVAAFVLATPLGGNAARLGALAAGPLADRPAVARGGAGAWPLVAVPLAYWVLYPPVRDWCQAAGDPARAAAYYAPLLAELARRRTPGAWRSRSPRALGGARVAPTVALARGWERQLDRRVNALFYDGALTAARYRAWLQENAVRWVALPDAPLDGSAAPRPRCIALGAALPARDLELRALAALRRAAPTPIGARALGPDWFITTGGVVRVRWTPYWAIVGGRGCVRRTPGDWTEVRPEPAGAAVRVAIRLGPARALSHGPRCR